LAGKINYFLFSSITQPTSINATTIITGESGDFCVVVRGMGSFVVIGIIV
jgi:hypothetical protein